MSVKHSITDGIINKKLVWHGKLKRNWRDRCRDWKLEESKPFWSNNFSGKSANDYSVNYFCVFLGDNTKNSQLFNSLLGLFRMVLILFLRQYVSCTIVLMLWYVFRNSLYSEFFSCDGCNVCIFCSRYCLSVAYKNYHRYECYGLQRHFWSMADTDYSYLAFRMMLYGASKNFETEPESCTYGSFSNNYPFINSLETNFDSIPRPVLNEILYVSTCCKL